MNSKFLKMSTNFFELALLEPTDGTSLDEQNILKDLQWILSSLGTGRGAINFEFRKSLDPLHPTRLLFLAIWQGIEDHYDLDLRGITPKILKVTLAHLKPVSVYFMYLDSSKVDLRSQVLTVEAFHILAGQKELFQSEVSNRKEVVGAWFVTKAMPPLPAMMPSDPVELEIMQGGRAMQEARLKEPTPEIWIRLSNSTTDEVGNDFRSVISGHVLKVETGSYVKFLDVGSTAHIG
jgi:hypothetical protein